MQQLTTAQYELTLKYMETINQDNFQLALAELKQHSFNIQHAINNKLNPPRHQLPPPNHQRAGLNDQQIIRKYIQFMRRKNGDWSPVLALFGLIKKLIFAAFRLFSKLLPYSIRLKLVGSDFQKLYYRSLPRSFSSKPLKSLLKLTGLKSAKSVMVLVSPQETSGEILNFMNNLEIQNIVSRSFHLTGHVIGHRQLAGVNEVEAPMLVVLRLNIFQELKQVGRTAQLHRVDGALLNVWAQQSRNLFKRDGNVMAKYRNFMNRMQGYGQFYEQQEEDQQVVLNRREVQREEIDQQNRAYQDLLQQANKQKQQQAQQRVKAQQIRIAEEQLQFERKARKQSIPQEPTEGDIIRLSFRCPDGSTLIRNFCFSQKLDLVYQWVELNDSISFENQQRRNFEIMHSYPPVPLSSRRESFLKDIFDSSQEKLVIKEL